MAAATTEELRADVSTVERLEAVYQVSGKVQASRGAAVLVRCGERLDRAFPEWLRLNVSDQGRYRVGDLNMPLALPARAGGPQAFFNDSPLSEMGVLTSRMLGRGLALHGLKLGPNVYASPALRCVQTAAAIIKAMGGAAGGATICVEPGLFELAGWYPKRPVWLTTAELEAAGVPVNVEYTPLVAALPDDEPVDALYGRLQRVTASLLAGERGCGTVIVGHATTLDAAARALQGRGGAPPHALERLNELGTHYPYNCALAYVPRADRNGAYQFVDDFVPPITYMEFTNRADLGFLRRH